jgi:hypothetical protein
MNGKIFFIFTLSVNHRKDFFYKRLFLFYFSKVLRLTNYIDFKILNNVAKSSICLLL